MNAQQLKNAILQEAIEGRLVPQDPNDEPASVLLVRIRKEKEKLVKEGKLKKKDLEVKPISEDEIPFKIPESWEWVRLKDIVMFIGGYAYDSSTFIASSNNQVLRLGNVKNDNILLNVNPVFIDDDLALDTEKFKCKENDILITMTGTRKKRDYFFSVLINSSHNNLYFNQRVGCLRSINENIAKWLILVLKAESILTDVFQYETGTANQGNLGADNILKTKIPLPPLAEQHRIVAKIENFLAKVEEYGKAQDALNKLNADLPERLKKSILQEAIEGHLVPQDPNDEPASVLLDKIRQEKAQLVKAGKLKKKDIVETPITEDEIPFDIPESWEWVRHNELFEISGGSQPPKSHFSETMKDGYVRLYQIRDYGETPIPVYIPTSEASKMTQKGDILLARYGGSLGKVFIAEEGAYNVAMAKVIYLFDKDLVYQKYLYWYYKGSLYQDLVKSNNRSAQGGFNKDDLISLLFPLPPLAEQHRIVEKLEQLFGKIENLKL